MRLHDFLEYNAREYPDGEFAVFGDIHLTYAEANLEANRLANALVSAGLQVGDRMAYLSKNSIDYAILYFAASKAGVVPVPLNYRLAPPEWAYIINDSQSKMLIATAEYQDSVDGIREGLGMVARYVGIDNQDQPGWDNYRAWVGSQASSPPNVTVTRQDDLYQMYTSGTTGNPKGAVLTHEAVVANVIQLDMTMPLERGDRVLIVAPIYHGAAAITCFVTVYSVGCLFIQEEFVPAEVVRALGEENVAIATMVPAMIQACLVNVPDVSEREYRTLKRILYGASPISEETLRRAMDVFKCDFAQYYGMTELTAVATYLSPEDHGRALRGDAYLLLSAGKPMLGTEMRIVDEDDNPLPNGEIGEMIVRGPQVMRGYWNMPDATAEALKGGWMHTGDAGMMDDEGYIYIQDRVKDMIVSGGENVYPASVENVLFQHPAVADAAVIGVPHERWGETVHAVIVLREGRSLAADEIMEFCRGKIGGFQLPRSVDFLDALPRNASGKVLKRELREPYWEGFERRVAGA